jgi:3-hydroxy-5-methyl-1-naphthoate 3-O-methyltransferase
MATTTTHQKTLSATPLMELVTSFWAFKTFAAAVELGVFTRLANGRALTLPQAAEELGIPERPADMFLAACSSLGLLVKDGDDRYRNSPLAEEFLVEGRPHYFGGLVRYCDHRGYPAWHRVLDGLREDRPLTWDPATHDSPFAAEDPVMLELFWEAMYAMSSSTARTVGEAYDFTGHRRLLDVGGGSAAYPIQLCQRYPHLTATVFDLPHVCPIAQSKIQAAGLEDRIGTVAGDFQTDEHLPPGHDVILLSSILHDWDEATGRALLDKCFTALPSGGAIVISELLLNPERTGPPAAALMGMNMIVETVGGRNYSESEYVAWLTDTGFRQPEVIRFNASGANGIVTARKS